MCTTILLKISVEFLLTRDKCSCFTFLHSRNCGWNAPHGSSSLYLLLLQTWWQKWHVIFSMKTAEVTSSLLWTKQFSIMKKIGYLTNLVPLQKRLCWWEGATPCVDPSKWLKKWRHYRSIRHCNPCSAFDKHKLASHLAAPFPSLHMYLFQQLPLFMLSAPVRGCALVCINNRNISDLVLIAIQQPEWGRKRETGIEKEETR